MSDNLLELVGPVAHGEFLAAKKSYHEELEKYARRLCDLTDQELCGLTETAIHGSALAVRFRGNWEHEHFKASACFHKSERRRDLVGHANACTGGGIYEIAHQRVMVSQGYANKTYQTCTCKVGSPTLERRDPNAEVAAD